MGEVGKHRVSEIYRARTDDDDDDNDKDNDDEDDEDRARGESRLYLRRRPREWRGTRSAVLPAILR